MDDDASSEDGRIDFSGLPAAAASALGFEPALIAVASLEALKRDTRLHRLAGPAPADLTRLSAAHRACIALHLSGSPAAEIAGRLQRPFSWVVSTLRDPLSRRVIDNVLAMADMEIAALVPLATAAVRQGLVSGNIGQKLRAADLAYKANHRYLDAGAESKSTAEDVIQQILAFAGKALEAAGAPRDAAASAVDVTPSMLTADMEE